MLQHYVNNILKPQIILLSYFLFPKDKYKEEKLNGRKDSPVSLINSRDYGICKEGINITIIKYNTKGGGTGGPPEHQRLTRKRSKLQEIGNRIPQDIVFEALL